MRICMVAQEFPPKSGGLGYHVYYLSKKLAERGHRVTVLTRGSWQRTYHEVIDGVSVYRVRFIPVYPFHLQPHSFFLHRQFKALESSFDIVHLHNPSIPVVRTSLPVAVTEHVLIRSFIKHLELLDLFSLVLKLSAPIYISLDRKVVNSADRIMAISQTCAEELRADYGVERVDVVSNGVDTSFFTPRENSAQPANVLYAGALTTEKGLPDLIRAATYVCRQYPDIKFILAGKGPLERNLRDLVRKLNLDANFSFIGFVNQYKLREYYQNATVFVLPSYHEGLPTVILEAMSCAIPVAATDVAGNSDVVVDGETGLLVPPKDPQQLSQAILRFLADEELRKKMGANARKRAEERYDWGIIINKIDEIYACLVS